MTDLRDGLSTAARALPATHYIDPGFVNERLVETIVGPQGIDIINERIRRIPDNVPDWIRANQIRHAYTRVALECCKVNQFLTLREVLAAGRGKVVCSTEILAPCPAVYEASRVEIPILLDDLHELKPELHLTTSRISSDTLRSRLHQGGPQSFIAYVTDLRGEQLVLEPLVLGAPWLEIDDPKWVDVLPWWSYQFYEHFVEDFDEFAAVKSVPTPSEFGAMASITEMAFKTCLAELLGDSVVKDWGGEKSDHFTAHLHLAGRRVTAAFLLKGPARFQPMALNTLGKNNDQIVRLASEPADVLFVQHCHDITPPVRETLRAFAVQPSRPRRYCLIDGRDSLRLLTAYDKVARAQTLSRELQGAT